MIPTRSFNPIRTDRYNSRLYGSDVNGHSGASEGRRSTTSQTSVTLVFLGPKPAGLILMLFMGH
jgi:hypothetical protein